MTILPDLRHYPMSAVTPFTYRDGRTYLEYLEELRRKLDEVIAAGGDQSDAFNELVAAVDSAIAEWQNVSGDRIDTFISTTNATINELRGQLVGYTISVDDDKYTASMQDGGEFTAYTDEGVERFARRSGQIDFVSTISRNSPLNALFVVATGTNDYPSFEVRAYNEDSHVTTTFSRGDSEAASADDYQRIWETWAGSSELYRRAPTVTLDAGDLSFIGAWTFPEAGQYVRTDEVGARFSGTFTCADPYNEITLCLRNATSGGLWRVSVKHPDGSLTVKDVSANGTGGVTTHSIADNVPPGVYTLAAQFLGPDPDNPPAAGDAIGWLTQVRAVGSTDPLGDVIRIYHKSPNVSRDILIAPASNFDHAILFNPASHPDGQARWLPYHGIKTAVRASDPVFKDERGIIAFGPGSSFTAHGYLDFVQHVYGRHPDTGTQNLIELRSTHRFHPDGRVEIWGAWTTLAPIIIDRAYHLMMPGNGALFNRVLTSIGNKYPHSANMAGTTTQLVDEGHSANGYAYSSTSNPDVTLAVRFDDEAATIRQSADGARPHASTAFIEHRTDTVVKVYKHLFERGYEIPTGETLMFRGEYARGYYPGAGQLG